LKKHILIPVLIFIFCIDLIYGLEKENLLNGTNFKVNETPYSHLINNEMNKKNDSQNKDQTVKTQINKTQVIKQNQSSNPLNSTNSSGNLSFST